MTSFQLLTPAPSVPVSPQKKDSLRPSISPKRMSEEVALIWPRVTEAFRSMGRAQPSVQKVPPPRPQQW